ncbi:MAG TPA: cupin domain-containing protein [Solirubrobacteraceae bacterium]|nr:cupin domain-containing protein [Solirubrobacteraceae bacterium]
MQGETGPGFAIVHSDDVETAGNWRLVRRTLGLRSFGVNAVEVMPGDTLPEHDELDRDQEELFFAVAGDAVLVIDGFDHPLPAGTYARVDPSHQRTVRNDGERPATVLIASAPTTSGYEPMGWA